MASGSFHRRLRPNPLVACFASVAVPGCAAAQALVVAATSLDPTSRAVDVELLATNSDGETREIAVAATIEASLSTPNGSAGQVRLVRAPDAPETVSLPASGFARLHYRFTLPPGTSPGPLSLALPGAPTVALVYPNASAPQRAEEVAGLSPAIQGAAEERGRNVFLANLSTYEPIYAVYGPNTGTDARIQISLQYQLFGTAGGARTSWIDGLRFGYTQQMFWDLGRASSPFRDVTYMPELFYVLPPLAEAGGWTFGGRFGLRHQSNGRSGDASRSFNIVYVEPEAVTRIGGLDIAVGPRAWIYVGSRSDNPRIARYRGNTGLYARIGRVDGLQLDTSGRLDPRSGKGAAEALLSYPLTRLFADGPRLYLFGQAFAGYGEDLLDYDRKQTRLRVGFGFTR